MKLITFLVFLDDRQKNVIRDWMDKIKMPVKCRAKMDRWVRYLEVTESEKWHPELIKPLRGHGGIYELRIHCMNVQYRPLGCFGPQEGQFTLLIGAIEKGSKLIPHQAPETAQGRRFLIYQDRSRTDEY